MDNKNIIVAELNIPCPPQSHQETFLISDTITYRNTFEKSLDDYNCELPPIDFEKYTLLGQYAGSGGCEIKFDRIVLSNKPQKTYRYIVTVTSKGLCEKYEESYNWVLVPKLPQGWQVKFAED